MHNLANTQGYCERQGVTVRKAVDAACSAGESTRRLAARFPEAQLAGIDLSPNFLAVAELRRRYWHPPSTVIHMADLGNHMMLTRVTYQN